MEKGYPLCLLWRLLRNRRKTFPPHHQTIETLLEIRQTYAFGEQQNYFDHPNTAGFVRLGDAYHLDSGVAVLLSNGDDGDKVMFVGENRKGKVWHEVTGNISEEVTIDDSGKGKFLVHGGKLAVWVKKPTETKQG